MYTRVLAGGHARWKSLLLNRIESHGMETCCRSHMQIDEIIYSRLITDILNIYCNSENHIIE